MKKSTFNLGEFRQLDKVFLTADNGIDCENVTSVAFDGETLYIAQSDGVFEYADGKPCVFVVFFDIFCCDFSEDFTSCVGIFICTNHFSVGEYPF